MKKNKGFTLIELLAVIVILAILLVIAVPNVIGISQRIKKNMFCSKIENIEAAARIYGNDNIDILEEKNNKMQIKVIDLVSNNLYKKENKDCEKRSKTNCVLDPRNNNSIDNNIIIINKKDKRVWAEYQFSEADKNVCK